jgi:AcrR family transcriptional regulator
VQYHFGDKDGLVQAIFAYRVWQMDEPRQKGLNALEAPFPDRSAGKLRDMDVAQFDNWKSTGR